MNPADIKAGMPVMFYPGDAGEHFGYVIRVTARGVVKKVGILYEKTANNYTVVYVDPAVVRGTNWHLTPARLKGTLRRFIRRVRAKDSKTTKMAASAAAVVLSEGLKIAEEGE